MADTGVQIVFVPPEVAGDSATSGKTEILTSVSGTVVRQGAGTATNLVFAFARF
jgi:hypothetical protein